MTIGEWKNELFIDRSRQRMALGMFVTRLAILFTLVCTVATVVMLLG